MTPNVKISRFFVTFVPALLCSTYLSQTLSMEMEDEYEVINQNATNFNQRYSDSSDSLSQEEINPQENFKALHIKDPQLIRKETILHLVREPKSTANFFKKVLKEKSILKNYEGNQSFSQYLEKKVNEISDKIIQDKLSKKCRKVSFLNEFEKLKENEAILTRDEIKKRICITYLETLLTEAMNKRVCDKGKISNNVKGRKVTSSDSSLLIGYGLMYTLEHKLNLSPHLLYMLETVRNLGSSGKDLTEIVLPAKVGEELKNRFEKCIRREKGIGYPLSLQAIITKLHRLREKNDKIDHEIDSIQEKIEDNREIKFVLSLDGGGCRGVLTAKLLSILMSKLKKSCKIDSITDVFDLFAGTSTGGILSVGLTCPQEKGSKKPMYRVKIMGKHYRTFAKDVFPSHGTLRQTKVIFSTQYSYKPLKKTLNNLIPEGLTLQDTVKDVLITSYNIDMKDLQIHTTRKAKKNQLISPLTLPTVCRMTSSAPTYFKGAKDKRLDETHIDGGVCANNPGVYAYEEALKLFPKARIVVVSLGTGVDDFEPVLSTEGMNVISNNVINPLFRLQNDYVEKFLQRELNSNPKEAQNYFRINPVLPMKIDLADSSDHILDYMEDIAEAMTKQPEWAKMVEGIEGVFEKKKNF